MDLSGNGNHGSLRVGYGTTDLPVREPGRHGGALHFGTTTGNWVEVPPSASLDALGNAFSVAAWVRLDPSTVQWYSFVSRWTGIQSFQIYHLATSGGGDPAHRFQLQSYDSINMVSEGVEDGASAPTGQWFQLTGTYDGSTFRLYRDGVEVESWNASVSVSPSPHPVMIGMMHRDTGEGQDITKGLKGTLDEVRIYDRALSAGEVMLLAQ